MTETATRRRFLSGVSLLAAGLAGCTGDDSAATDGTETTSAGTNETGTTTTRADGTDTEESLDLREANVVGVSVEAVTDGYRFDVTLYHDDDGEDGYANWWQVESRDGERLGRRDLAHPHGTHEFTRSATVEVSDDVGTVVVRGHDQTHGYGGQAMLVTIETGEKEAVRQGPEPDDFGE